RLLQVEFAAVRREAEDAVADRTGDEDAIAGPGAVAAQRAAGWDRTDQRRGQRQRSRRLGGVAAPERNVELGLVLRQAFGEFRDPGLVDAVIERGGHEIA